MKGRPDVLVRLRFDREASKIMLLPDGHERSRAAAGWCDEHGSAVVMMSLDFAMNVPSVRRHIEHARELICAAVAGHQPLDTMLRDIRAAESGGEGALSPDALLPLLVLWPVRDTIDRYPDALAAWARERVSIQGVCDSHPWSTAHSLRAWPALAYAILDVLRSYDASAHRCESPSGRTCADARQAILVLTRLAEGHAEHEGDGAALASTTLASVLENDAARAAACVLASSDRLPAHLAEGARKALAATDPATRVRAVRVLLASPVDHDAAIRTIASWYDRGDVDADLLVTDTVIDGACAGPGWGRSRLPKKFLPITGALWRRENRLRWHPLWRLIAASDDAGNWERVRECVGELLLQRASDVAGPRKERNASLDALEALHPGGSGSIARALSKIKDDKTLATRAKAVQRSLNRGTAVADGELAVEAAWIAYWHAIDAE